MRAELTYTLDGRVLGIELSAGGHGRDLREGDCWGLRIRRSISGSQSVCGLLYGGELNH